MSISPSSSEVSIILNNSILHPFAKSMEALMTISSSNDTLITNGCSPSMVVTSFVVTDQSMSMISNPANKVSSPSRSISISNASPQPIGVYTISNSGSKDSTSSVNSSLTEHALAPTIETIDCSSTTSPGEHKSSIL